MPCTIELLESHSAWYCCNCGDGPMDAAVSPACTSCNNHERCGSKGHNACIPTPPDSPLCASRTGTRRLKQRVRGSLVSKNVSATRKSRVSACRGINMDEGGSGVLTTSYETSKRPPNTSPDEDVSSIQEAIELLTNTILDSRSTLLSTTDVAPTTGVKSCPSRGQARARAPQGSSQRVTQQSSDKENRQRNSKKVSDGRSDDHESEDDVSSKPPNGRLGPDRVGQPYRKLACPFCKFNPHRYRHKRSCKQGWASASKLR